MAHFILFGNRAVNAESIEYITASGLSESVLHLRSGEKLTVQGEYQEVASKINNAVKSSR